jgi:thiamine biosynthesis protein ThiS
MNICVNGESSTVLNSISVDELITKHISAQQNVVPGIAVAVNGTILRHSLWQTAKFSEGDEVEILYPVAGG